MRHIRNPTGTAKLTDMARDELGLVVQFVPGGELPPPGTKPFFRFLDRTLSKTIRDRIDRPFWIDTVGASNHVDIRIDLGGAIMKVLVRRSQTYASNTHIFLLWMMTTSIILLTVAVLFLRNQIKPILALAQAAECFGRGQPAPAEFPRARRARGAAGGAGIHGNARPHRASCRATHHDARRRQP